jgi:glycosyltransferase involved in cell wall biosynthesis
MQGLVEAGVRNTLVCPAGSEIATCASAYGKTYQININGDLDPRFPLQLIRIIRDVKPDLVHVHSRRGADVWGGFAALLTRTRAVITRRVDNREAPLVARTKYGLYVKVIAISEAIRRVLVSEAIPPARIVCIPSGIDPNPYHRPCDPPWFQETFELTPGNRTVGVVAQLIPRKGHRFLLEAAPAILTRFPETKFLFFGQGPERDDLERLCHEIGIAHAVRFAGFRKDMARILPCLDLVVHPATMEGLGVSLLEAASSGRAIVAARAGGIPEVVHHGLNGLLVEPGNAGELIEAVSHLLADPGLSARLGAAGRRLVEEKFSVAAMVKGNIELYSEVLRAGTDLAIDRWHPPTQSARTWMRLRTLLQDLTIEHHCPNGWTWHLCEAKYRDIATLVAGLVDGAPVRGLQVILKKMVPGKVRFVAQWQGQSVFVKATALRPKEQVRATLRMHNMLFGFYKGPAVECANTLQAMKRTTYAPRVFGFGESRSRWGLVRKQVILFEGLDHHMRINDLLDDHPEDHDMKMDVMKRAGRIILDLYGQGLAHLDLSTSKVLLHPNSPSRDRIIDLEPFLDFRPYLRIEEKMRNILAYYFGYLYRLYGSNYVDEKDYDDFAFDHFSKAMQGKPIPERLVRAYNLFKHRTITHSKRILMVKTGWIL